MFLIIGIMILFHLSVTTTNTPKVYMSKRSGLDYICHETISNRTKVPKCPGNDKAARERSKMKKCDNYKPCNGETLVYHCARDNDSLVEACAPIVTILGFCCAQFNVGVGRVIADFKEPCPTCPFKYYSNESWKYKSCVRYSEGTPVTEQVRERTTATTFTNSCENVTLHVGPTKKSKSQAVEENDNPRIILTVVLLVTTLTILLTILFLKLFPKAKDKLPKCIPCVKTENISEIGERDDFIPGQNIA